MSVPEPMDLPKGGAYGVRASNSDRQRYADLISAAYADGQLDYSEMSERLDAALQAKTIGELPPLVADINRAALAVPDSASTTAQAKTTTNLPAKAEEKKGWSLRRKVALFIVGAVAVVGIGVGRVVARNVDWDTITGPANYTITAENQLPPGYSLDMGSLRLDLTDLVLTEDKFLTIEADLGSATIVLPRNTNVRLIWDVDLGSVHGPGISNGGGTGETLFEPNPGGPTLTIDASVDLGDLTLIQPS